MASVLVIGSGGREHALAWKLSHSSQVKQVLVAPGNGGTHGDGKILNVSLNVDDHAEVVALCKARNVSLVCVGPEVPLVNGIADDLRKANVLCFGPGKAAARLEGSKAFSKEFMVRNGIPTAKHESFTEFEKAVAYVKSIPNEKVVVKASGLAAGKGVILPNSLEETILALKQIMVDKEFGEEAGAEVVVEELMEGPEVSVFAFCDGNECFVLPGSQDHKRIFDNDQGPNTGGMGAYCPAPVFTNSIRQLVEKEIVVKSVNAAKREGFPFIGLLYCGIMLTPNGPRLLEYNCRFGDPETQAVLMLLESDLYKVMMACAREKLSEAGPIVCNVQKSAATVVCAAAGYPGKYGKGQVIAGCQEAESLHGVKVFHAGTSKNADQVVSSGGRVLAVSAVGDTLQEALDKAYAGVSCVHFDGMQFRRDIGKKGLAPKSRALPSKPVSIALAVALAAISVSLLVVFLKKK